jgi:2-polyprenyl-6-methoxyphenol hydroxylase-like FAD-dependent oxidoreductase
MIVCDFRGGSLMLKHDTAHAVVLGGSLTGMAVAKVLAGYMNRVMLVERDRFPDRPEWRRGLPQARHTHNLLGAGQGALEQLYPGLGEELAAAGMVRVRMPEDMLLLLPGGWSRRFQGRHVVVSGSRDLLDWTIRERLRKEPNVEFLEETEAIGLLGDKGGQRVTGVRLRARDSAAPTGWGEAYDMTATLVVDATGRTSRTPEWLKELGHGVPTESVVDAKTAYATCVFEPPSGHSADWKCILLQATLDEPCTGILNPIENGRWMVSAAALGGERPPHDHEGFKEFTRGLRSTVIYDAIRHAEPLTPVYGSGRTENRRRHYEKLKTWPEGFMVLGDAVGSFNPSYGQGISVAAMTAVSLSEELHKIGSDELPPGFAAGFRAKVAKNIDAAWMLSANADLGYPWASEGKPPLAARLGGKYMNRLLNVATEDQTAALALFDMTHMVAPPQAVFQPRVLAATLRGRRRPAEGLERLPHPEVKSSEHVSR